MLRVLGGTDHNMDAPIKGCGSGTTDGSCMRTPACTFTLHNILNITDYVSLEKKTQYVQHHRLCHCGEKERTDQVSQERLQSDSHGRARGIFSSSAIE